jgi:hypothetical protein
MKNIYISLVITTCLLGGLIEASPKKAPLRAQRAMKSERELLIDECHIVAAVINEKFCSGGQWGSPGQKRAVKRGITLYLNSVGTPQARKLLAELEDNGFKGFV